ncbi:MAG: preprotein translocase subunit SecG [Myxococcales bacterium]|nr:preprotein translocase subunit SecG [Myxococcales bacterium]
MSTLITILHIMVCIFLMLTVLLQSGKGGGMGAAFGGGNAATVFGGSGASSFLRRLTAGAGTLFMATSMVLAFIASHNSADALEKFGEQQEKLAAEKEAAKQKVLEGSGSAAGSASGSASAGSAAGSATEGSAGSAAGSAGAAMDPADIQNGPTGGMSGTAVTPSENPVPATRPDQKPNPATPTSMGPPTGKDVKPAEAPPAAGNTAPAAGTTAPAAGTTAPDVKLSDPKDLKPTDTAKPADSSPNAPK